MICPQPSKLEVLEVKGVTALLNWDAVPGAVGYRVQVKSPNSFEDFITDGNTYLLSDLSPETSYHWRVLTICADEKSPFTWGPTFTTLEKDCCNGRNALNLATRDNRSSCSEPANLLVEDIKSTAATLSWDAVPEALAYQVQLKSASSFENFMVDANVYPLEDLTPDTYYLWRVSAVCSEQKSEMVFGENFTTLKDNETNSSDFLNQEDIQGGNKRLLTTPGDVRVYPNPAHNVAKLSFAEAPNSGSVHIQNMLGHKLAELPLNGQSSISLPLEQWGIHDQLLLISIEIEGQPLITKKLMIK